MPDLAPVLAVLIAVLALAGGGALVGADRAVAPPASGSAAPDGDPVGARAAAGVTARRGAVSLLVAGTVLLVSVSVANATLRSVVADAVFAAPLLAAAAGLAVYAVLQSRRLVPQPVSESPLGVRRAGDLALRRTFVAAAPLGALLLLLAAVGASTPVAAFTGARAAVLPVSMAVLLASSVFALRRIAVRPALPDSMRSTDLAVRRLACRFVLLLSSSATLATTALVAVQAGGWLWGTAPVLAGSATSAGLVTAAGATVALVGAAAGVGALACAGALVLTCARHALPARRVAGARSRGVHA